ncbi:MAG: large-conductance mechanosensitive channel protein MscL [Blastochloris viridis]|uniref:Large-conductance mechanosensitive channel n=1 Tax=Blastochloris viridis TaxID=1079 RepID=A0A6N4RC61_BLAVI|nr:MAG: large-conductance mechanosensitive channel protein MscL [Blastochloris viridis]
MSILTEFKQFAMRGNVIDLAVGVVIGSAFGKIVSSMVDNIIMPPLGVLINNVDFKDLGIVISAADPATNKPAVVFGYGAFLQTCLDFMIIAFAIFMLVRLINKLSPKPAPAPKGPSQEELLTQIRDLLKAESKAAPAKAVAKKK